MSRIIDVIKNKNRIEKESRRKRKEEMRMLQSNSEYKASLLEYLEQLNILMDNIEVESIEVEIPEKNLGKFSSAIYSDDLTEYEIAQDTKKANRFIIKKKYISY